MKITKVFCPHCGRCLGQCTSSDGKSVEKILTEQPTHLKKKQIIQEIKCIKCKNHLYISIEFID